MMTYYINGVRIETVKPIREDQMESLQELMANHRYNTRTNWDQFAWRLKNGKGNNRRSVH